jgi:hypothetical protein
MQLDTQTTQQVKIQYKLLSFNALITEILMRFNVESRFCNPLPYRKLNLEIIIIIIRVKLIVQIRLRPLLGLIRILLINTNLVKKI